MKGVHSIIFLIIILLQGCQKDREIISGTIAGKMNAYTQNGKSIPALDSVEVNLYNDTTFIASTLTDEKGQCSFENVPYGRYNLQCKKEKFAQMYGGVTVAHVGGYCPTYTDLWIFEVPTYELFIDSIGYVKSEYYFYFRLRPDPVYPQLPQVSFRAFAGSNNNVSKDNYVSAGKGYLTIWYPVYPAVVPTYGRMGIWDFDQNIEKLKNDTIFLRIYPIASQQGYNIMQYSPESVGKPSNVIKFLWNSLVIQ
jgi:hypothetical protein